MATLHIMVGLPCSGKTTKAIMLEETHHALRLTPDEWQLRLFGDDMADSDHDRRHDAVEGIMWDVAERALSLGASVILDFGFWAREERTYCKERALALGADFAMHYMDVSDDELMRRLASRNEQGNGKTFVIPEAEMRKYIRLFQPPDREELDNG